MKEMNLFKRTMLAVALSAALLTPGATCRNNPAPADVQIVQGADSVVSVLFTFSHAVENAVDEKLLTNRQGNQILRIVKAANLTLQETPKGGFEVASQALDQVEATVSPDVKTKIQPYLTTARAALEAFHVR